LIKESGGEWLGELLHRVE